MNKRKKNIQKQRSINQFRKKNIDKYEFLNFSNNRR